MATVQELEDALIRADRDGDTGAAKILAQEIKQAQRQQRLNTPQFRSSVVGQNQPSTMESMGRGFMDIPEAARYVASGGKRDPVADDDERIYQQGRGPDAGFDAARFAGNTLGTVPLTGPMAAGARLAGVAGPVARATVGAAQGVTQGTLTHTPEGGSKTSQAFIGGATGAMAPFVANAVGAVVSRVAQFGKEAAARFAAKPEAIVAELEPILAQQGIKWAELADDVKGSMVLQARRQLSATGQLAPDALARKVEMDEVLGPNAGPTQGQVTRDPQQWSWERNTQKLQGVGEDLTNRYQAQIQRLRDVAQQAIERTGGRARNDFQAGSSATEAVKSKMDESKGVVDKLYDTWRSTGAGGTTVKPQAIADELGGVLDDIGEENIPAAVKSRLQSFGMLGGKQTKHLTIDEAEKLRRLIGNNDPGHGPQALASGRLKRAVDEAVMATDAPEIPALQEARKAAHARFAMRDSAPGVTAAAKDDAPDRFFNRFVLNGNVRDIQGLKQTLNSGFMDEGAKPQGVQAWKDLKGRVVEHLVEKATVKDGAFSGAQFRKAIKEIGEERMKVIFDPDELAQLSKLDRVAHGVSTEPNLAAVNHSNTAATGAQYLQDAGRMIPSLVEKATNIPFLGKMAAGAWTAGDQVAKNAEMRRRVGQSLLGNAFDPQDVLARRTELAKLISGAVTPYATIGGAAGSLSLTDRGAR